MKRTSQLLLLILLCLPPSAVAQSEWAAPPACDLSELGQQGRFFQRGNAPDDLTDDDLWKLSSLGAQGINSDILLPGLAKLEDSRTRQAFILMRNGYIVFEQYYNGSSAKDSNNVASVSKSILSALIGIAMQQGHITSVEDRLAEHLPKYFAEVGDQRLLDLTIRDMLTMTHGLDWRENDSDRALNRSGDWVAEILALPIINERGTLFNYSTGASHVLSALLTEATGMSTCEFAHRYLLEPLGVEAEFWGVDPQGYFAGGHSVSLTAREVARFGQLFLNEGSWQGQQLVPGWWVAASTTARFDIGNSYAGYGYYWWLNRMSIYDMYSALGAGGQILHVIPDLDIVMVTTHGFSGNPRDYAEEAESYQFLLNYLIPATIEP